MELSTYIIILLSALIITIISTIVGFGSKLMLIAVLSLFLNIKEAIVIAAIYSIMEYILRIFYFHKNLNKKLVGKMVLFLIPGIIIGLIIFKNIEIDILKIIFSVFLILYSAYIISGFKFKFRLNDFGLGIIVFIFGILESAIGAAGPLMAMALLHYGKRKERFIVFAAVLFLVSGITRVIGYANLGFVKLDYILLMVLLFITTIISTYIGKKLLKKVPEKFFEYFVLAVLLLIGIKNLVGL